MDPLFIYDDGASIPFYVEANQGTVEAQIQQYGGSLASAFEARFHIFGLVGASVLPMDPNVPVVRARWVADSIREQRMLPIYPYLDNRDLQHLSIEDRDVAELLKAKIGNPEDGVFNQLHKRLPHDTTDAWRTLYQDFQVEIQMALARIVPSNQEQLNRLVFPIFPRQAIPVDQRLPRGVDVRDQGRALRAPREDHEEVMGDYEYSDGTEQLDSEDRTDSGSISEPPFTSASVYQESLVLDSEADGGYEEYSDEETETEYADSGRPLSPSETPPPRTRNNLHTGGGVRFTQVDYDAMVQFLSELDHEPVTADWETFRSLVSDVYRASSWAELTWDPLSASHSQTNNNRVRSADAWRRKYSKDREIILAEVLRMRAQGV